MTAIVLLDRLVLCPTCPQPKWLFGKSEVQRVLARPRAGKRIYTGHRFIRPLRALQRDCRATPPAACPEMFQSSIMLSFWGASLGVSLVRSPATPYHQLKFFSIFAEWSPTPWVRAYPNPGGRSPKFLDLSRWGSLGQISNPCHSDAFGRPGHEPTRSIRLAYHPGALIFGRI